MLDSIAKPCGLRNVHVKGHTANFIMIRNMLTAAVECNRLSSFTGGRGVHRHHAIIQVQVLGKH